MLPPRPAPWRTCQSPWAAITAGLQALVAEGRTPHELAVRLGTILDVMVAQQSSQHSTADTTPGPAALPEDVFLRHKHA